jgi:hypothetical protein
VKTKGQNINGGIGTQQDSPKLEK